MLVQASDMNRFLYSGVCENRNTRTNFDMVHLKNCPPQLAHLSGLLHLFKDKLVSKLNLKWFYVGEREWVFICFIGFRGNSNINFNRFAEEGGFYRFWY